MAATLVFTRDASQHRLELSGVALTIGRGAECDLRISDERISVRHCRLSRQDGEWMIEDLKSTNRTFVNGELLGDRPRRLVHGDLVRLGAHGAVLFEAKFVAEANAIEPRGAPPAAADALHRRIAELEAALAARNAELVVRNAEMVARNAELARIGEIYKRAQGQLGASEAAAAAARRTLATMASEIEELRDELARERTDHAGCRDDVERARRRCAELEAQLEARARKARKELDDGDRSRKDLESRLSLASSELAVTRAALATATDNVRSLKAAYDDVLARLNARALD